MKYLDLLNRTRAIYTEEEISKLLNFKVAVFGLGGVGGTAFEALVRTGVKNLFGFDKDEVDPSNLNRQILYTSKDISESKAKVAEARARAINPEAHIKCIEIKIDKDYLKSSEILKEVDYVIDAIDDVDAKIDLYEFCLAHNIPFISCLGMANRKNPQAIKRASLNQTSVDPLARKLRYLVKDRGLDLTKINVLYSTEVPISNGGFLGSTIFVPSSAGLLLANIAIEELLEK